MVTSIAAGEPVAGSCCGATAGPGTAPGTSCVGSTVGCVGGATQIEPRGIDDDVDANDELELGGTLDDDDDELELELELLGGTLDDELELELLGGTLDDELELELLGGTLDDELELLEELGGTDEELDEELLDVYGSLDDVLDDSVATPRLVFTMDVLDVCVSVAAAGPTSSADAPNATPIPSTIHPALFDRSMTLLRSRQKT